jgi:hypothetical protein
MVKKHLLENDKTKLECEKLKNQKAVQKFREKEKAIINKSKEKIERSKEIKKELFQQFVTLQNELRLLHELYQSPTNFSHETINKLLLNDEEKICESMII